jgi:hypothetical protein
MLTGTERRTRSRKSGNDLWHQAIATLGALVGIGVGAKRYRLMRPGRPPQLPCQDVADVDLDNDLPVEVLTCVEIEVGMGVPGEAVNAAMATTSIGVDRPVERKACRLRHRIQRRLRQYLMESDASKLRRPYRPYEVVQPIQPRQGVWITCLIRDLLPSPPHPTIQT